MGPRSIALAVALAALAAALLVPAVASPAEPELPTGFQDSVVFSGLEQPTAVRFAPNGMVFVAEKAGKIKVFEDTEDNTAELFEDLRTEVYDHGDRGLLGLAVDPGFPASPYVYALFSYDHVLGEGAPPPKWGLPDTTGDSCPEVPGNGADDCLVSGRLVRYTANVSEDGEGHLHAVASGEKALIPEEWCQQFSSHSVGDLRFGPEGALYASGGDGASFASPDYGQLGEPPNPCGDPHEEGGSMRAQDLRTPETPGDPTGLDGTIVRIDPETGAAWPGNPLSASLSANERRIVALGFRNPFRFAIDSQNGEVYAENVGSSEFEEIDRFDPSEPTVFNSGWPCFEGNDRQFQFKWLALPVCEGMYEEPGSASTPLFHYSHRQGVTPGDECHYNDGSALAGISLYEGTQFPAAYKGALFFADSVRGCFYAMLPDSDGRPDPDQIQGFLSGGSLYPGIDIQEGPDGSLYYTSLFGEGFSDGAVHKITYVPGAPQARLEADTTYAKDLSHVYQLDATKSSDPTGEALEFEWDLDGNGSFETKGGETQARAYGSPQNVVVSVRVIDGKGLVSVAKLTLYPGDEPPVPAIAAPAPGTEWSVGDTIAFSGSALDAAGDPVYHLALHWGTRILHCPTGPDDCHSHPLQVFPGVTGGELVAPEHEYPSYIEITLTATDKRGLSASKTIKLQARGVNLRIESQPPGIPLTAGIVSTAAPFDVPVIQNSQLTLAAPETAELNGTTYAWQSWSDGGDRNHTVTAAGSNEYTAFYAAVPDGEEPPPGGGPGPENPAPGGGGAVSPPSSPSPQVPATTLGKGPPKQTRSTTAKFTFGASVAGASFRCKLDGKPAAPCRSPKTYRKLRPGRHTFKVWATAGVLTDPTPAKFSWKVLPR
ncbi:MAG: PQQ-dependent sugar dehydrogenase [Actinomycetota bacterium]|nr:PQQ-dependent sugar dehydrogenase [Actinomycetota bacterium]